MRGDVAAAVVPLTARLRLRAEESDENLEVGPAWSTTTVLAGGPLGRPDMSGGGTGPLCLRCFRRHQKTMLSRAQRRRKPPTKPPAMAPALIALEAGFSDGWAVAVAEDALVLLDRPVVEATVEATLELVGFAVGVWLHVPPSQSKLQQTSLLSPESR